MKFSQKTCYIYNNKVSFININKKAPLKQTNVLSGTLSYKNICFFI